ncbi:hypothetical protein CB1_000298008 [Camelus ferus]|nr:hypothetical protein CB1_000298008 [Camelus ferus]
MATQFCSSPHLGTTASDEGRDAPCTPDKPPVLLGTTAGDGGRDALVSPGQVPSSQATPPVFTTERDVPEDCGGMRPLPSAAGGGRGPGIVVPESARTPNSLTCGEERGELRASRQRMDLVAKQQESVAAEVAAEREANNMVCTQHLLCSAAERADQPPSRAGQTFIVDTKSQVVTRGGRQPVGRLEAASRRLRLELEKERDLQSRVTAVLQESERAMWHMEIREGQLEGVRKSAQEEAVAAKRFLQKRGAAEQLRKEAEAAGKVERNRLLRVRKSTHLQKELGLRHQKLMEDAQRSRRQAVRFLKASLGRVREREWKAELESRQHMQRRMDAVLALKNSITANRETLRKFQAWGQARAELAEQRAQAEKEAVLAQGGDAFRHLCHQRRQQELEAQNQ